MKPTYLLVIVSIAACSQVFTACSGDDASVTGGSDAGSQEDSGSSSSGDNDNDPSNQSPPGDSGANKPADSGGDGAGGKTGISFFVSSTGSGNAGGNLGGLDGADKKCQELAKAAGAGGRTWHAYLSTTATGGGQLVNAKDRIGKGPWYNQKNEMVAADVAALHTTDIPAAKVLDEKGGTVANAVHDILTGSKADGTPSADDNCRNWTSNNNNGQSRRAVGHSNSTTTTGGANDNDRWNFAHANAGCSEASIAATGGNGRIYCFAID
jgi:hypothetical protein